VSTFFGVFSSHNPGRTITLDNLPTPAQVMQSGLGGFPAPVWE